MYCANRILLVDDDNVNNFLNKKLIYQLGFAKEVVICKNGIEALNYLQNNCTSPTEIPNLIILDLKMPVLDGFDFLKIVTSLNIAFINIPIVILTVARNGDDIIRLRDLGSFQIVNKPLTEDKLLDIFHRYFRKPGLETA